MTQHHYCHHDLRWRGNLLRLHSGRLLAKIEPDARWPGMWRIRTPDGVCTDMVNISRAKDAAVSLALAALPSRDRDAA
jgi:hypothetical protein